MVGDVNMVGYIIWCNIFVWVFVEVVVIVYGDNCGLWMLLLIVFLDDNIYWVLGVDVFIGNCLVMFFFFVGGGGL